MVVEVWNEDKMKKGECTIIMREKCRRKEKEDEVEKGKSEEEREEKSLKRRDRSRKERKGREANR